MKVYTLTLVLVASAAIDGATAFLPKTASGGRAFAVFASAKPTASEHGVKTTTDVISNQLNDVLSDPSFVGPSQEAEHRVFGKMMHTLEYDEWMQATSPGATTTNHLGEECAVDDTACLDNYYRLP